MGGGGSAWQVGQGDRGGRGGGEDGSKSESGCNIQEEIMTYHEQEWLCCLQDHTVGGVRPCKAYCEDTEKQATAFEIASVLNKDGKPLRRRSVEFVGGRATDRDSDSEDDNGWYDEDIALRLSGVWGPY